MRTTLALAALVAVLGGGLFVVWESKVEQATRHKAEMTAMQNAVESLYKAREADQATLARLRQKNASTARKQAFLARSLEAATAANPDWAAQPLPKEVKEALEAARNGSPGPDVDGLRITPAP
jgi:uncharacterized protein YcaQ